MAHNSKTIIDNVIRGFSKTLMTAASVKCDCTGLSDYNASLTFLELGSFVVSVLSQNVWVKKHTLMLDNCRKERQF